MADLELDERATVTTIDRPRARDAVVPATVDQRWKVSGAAAEVNRGR